MGEAAANRARNWTALQQQIRQYRPWYDNSVRGLTILKSLTEKFPEDGSVTAKTVEIQDLNTVTCTGIARDCQALLKTVERLRTRPGGARREPGSDARAATSAAIHVQLPME